MEFVNWCVGKMSSYLRYQHALTKTAAATAAAAAAAAAAADSAATATAATTAADTKHLQ